MSVFRSQKISTKSQIETSAAEGLAAQRSVNGLGPTMVGLNAMAAEIARTDIPVMIFGESGTGKDAYARLIHSLSQEGDSKFWKINCSAVDPENLLAQIHEATVRFSNHEVSGSIYLDKIHELDLACQRVLLSYLPDGEGPGSEDLMHARLISSSTRSLDSDVEAGRFRRDFYFRLNGVSLRLPPLRERPEDIPVLIEYFLNKHSLILKKNVFSISKKAIQSMIAYHWPGNIRELEHFAQKVVLFEDVQMALKDLQAAKIVTHKPVEYGPGASLKVAARAASKEAERELIMQALERTHWNRKRAAQELQISYKSLLYKIKQVGTLNEEQQD